MPLVQLRRSVAANGTDFPLQGSTYEFMGFAGTIEVAANQQSGAIGDVLMTFNSGPDLLMEEGVISANARLPIYPDDYFLKDEVAPGDRLRIQLRNTTGGAIVVVVAINITPAI